MNEIIKDALIFVAGGTIGALIAHKITKSKYESIIDEEINSVKEMYAKRQKEILDVVDETFEKIGRDDYFQEVKEISEDNGYVSKSEDPKEPVENNTLDPYYIEEDEYGTDEEYECCELYYYTDGVLADDIDERANLANVPPDYEDQFAHGDSVYVRNPILKCDFEIIKVDTTYVELCEEKPHLKYRD